MVPVPLDHFYSALIFIGKVGASMEWLSEIEAGHLFITFEVLEDGSLPAFKGSAFRGIMGHALRELADSVGEEENLYMRVFESKDHQGGFAPHPFVLRCNDYRTEVKAGDTISFEISTLGFLNHFAAELCQCFERMGDIGLGVSKLPLKLSAVEAFLDDHTKKAIYINGNIVSPSVPPKVLSLNSRPEEVIIEFVTPARIIHLGKLQKSLEYPVLINNITNRINQLVMYYYPEICEKFEALLTPEVVIVRNHLKVESIERYSNRKNQKMSLKGLTGLQKYAGKGISETYPLLKLAELIHVGKSTSMGFGQVKIWM